MIALIFQLAAAVLFFLCAVALQLGAFKFYFPFFKLVFQSLVVDITL